MTSVFTLTNAVLFQGGGIDDPSSAVQVNRAYRNGVGDAWSYSAYLVLRDASPDIQLEAGVSAPIQLPLGSEGSSSISVRFVTGGYLRAVRDRPALGRLLTAEDDRAGGEPVGVLSHGYWSRDRAFDRDRIGEKGLEIHD